MPQLLAMLMGQGKGKELPISSKSLKGSCLSGRLDSVELLTVSKFDTSLSYCHLPEQTIPMESAFLITFLIFCLAKTCYGGVLFSSLPRTLVVTASPQQGQVFKAGEERITVTWGLNQSLHEAGTDDLYKNVKIALCYAPVSQRDRAWRKTVDDLSKDKTCQFTIDKRPYDASKRNQSLEWSIEKDIPTATYFVRAYAYNSAKEEVAFGQTTDSKKSSNLFEVQAVSGRHLSLEIASACFSAFSVVSLFGFFLVEKREGKGFSKN